MTGVATASATVPIALGIRFDSDPLSQKALAMLVNMAVTETVVGGPLLRVFGPKAHYAVPTR